MHSQVDTSIPYIAHASHIHTDTTSVLRLVTFSLADKASFRISYQFHGVYTYLRTRDEMFLADTRSEKLCPFRR